MMAEDGVQKLQDLLREWDLFPDGARCERVMAYYELLSERNENINLTAITTYDDFCRLHVADSLLLLPALQGFGTKNTPDEAVRLLDIGSGAGFPGAVLKLFCPDWEVTLLEAQQKRVRFLQELCDTVFPEEEGFFVRRGRAEEFGRDTAFRERFSLVTARAVSSLSVLAEYALPFLRTGGVFAAYKAVDSDAEIREAKEAVTILGGRIGDVFEALLPDSDIWRRIVLIEKTAPTPARFPRRPGIPEKRPLSCFT